MSLLRILAAAALLLATALPAAATTLSVRADYWPPYNGDPASERPGYMVEVLREIFAAQGIAVDYQLRPWNRAVAEVRNGQATALLGSDAEETPGLVFPREAFGIHVNGFFVRGGNPWRYQGVESLRQVRLGVISGYSYGAALDGYLASAARGAVVAVSGEKPLNRLLELLAARQIDVLVENVNVLTYTRREVVMTAPQLASVEVAGYEFIDKCELYVGFSPAAQDAGDYARRFDEGLERLRRSGRLREILGKYGIRDWK